MCLCVSGFGVCLTLLYMLNVLESCNATFGNLTYNIKLCKMRPRLQFKLWKHIIRTVADEQIIIFFKPVTHYLARTTYGAHSRTLFLISNVNQHYHHIYVTRPFIGGIFSIKCKACTQSDRFLRMSDTEQTTIVLRPMQSQAVHPQSTFHQV